MLTSLPGMFVEIFQRKVQGFAVWSLVPAARAEESAMSTSRPYSTCEISYLRIWDFEWNEILTRNIFVIDLHAPEFSWILLTLERGKNIQHGRSHEDQKIIPCSGTWPHGSIRLMDLDSATSIYPQNSHRRSCSIFIDGLCCVIHANLTIVDRSFAISESRKASRNWLRKSSDFVLTKDLG